MTTVIGGRFRTAGKIYYFDPQKLNIKKGQHVIVETARGIEYGTVVIGCREAQQLTGLGLEQLKKPLQTMTSPPIPGLRLIPYRAVGAENGLLLAMRFPAVKVGGRSHPGIVAFAPQSFGEDFQAIVGGVF